MADCTFAQSECNRPFFGYVEVDAERHHSVRTQSAVPFKLTVCGEFEALSGMFQAAVRLPVTVGLNSKLTVQLAPAGRALGQLVEDWRKELALVPVKLCEPSVTDADPVFLSVTTCAADVAPTLVEEKVRLLGDTVRVPVEVVVAVPARVTFCGELEALSVRLQVAVKLPAAVGLNSKSMVQLAPAAIVLGQLVED